ncbi:E3 ubiquitin-protein ligase ZSWIM2 [Callorhinchus milii]|uniref:E3 ubiquitin-protein ligase ZSWIM2 n=1 Tax=Callorhinchus milii TaxID=7868 RepID=UPI001C3FE193|nr:E3 ubiquitin-protein ligase ZSWIM2 [Callorhinchus milii]
MLRAAPWRQTANDLVSLHQDQALNATIYILRELGPVGFHLKEEGEAKYFKVNIGNPHSCSCSTFLKEKDLCKHICWILLKKFKLPRDHENSFQIGLVDREIDMLLENLHRETSPQPLASRSRRKQTFEDVIGLVRQKVVELEDVCPICQEELLKKKQPVTYCRFGCGNNIHIRCMKIWAEHQAKIDNENIIKCPLCREEFAPLNLLLEEFRNCIKLTTAAERERLDKHLGIPCNTCKVCPIQGKCYKCASCSDFHLCQKCYPNHSHYQHQFMFREKRNHRWHPVQHASGQPLPSAVIADLMNREIAPEDYELLLQLDKDRSSSVPQNIVGALPLLVVRHGSKLLLPGQQCRICLKVFRISQHVRRLPCNHKFHRECIDHWLLHERNACPIDGEVVYHPLTWNAGLNRGKSQEVSINSQLVKPDVG